MANMKKTQAGLPNTCSSCGTPVAVKDGWFARNDEQARTGQGLCQACARPKGRRIARTKAAEEEKAVEAEPQKDSGEGSLENLTVEELQEMARERDVEGRSGMNKAELIEAIREAEVE